MTTQVEPPGARSGTRNYVLFLLLMLTILSFVDRQVLTILLDPIKHELALTDTQLGALTGVFFSLFYAAAGLPLARLADGREKRSFIAACIAGWSIATVFTGLAMNFVQLAISRTLVAVGEAGCAPATASLIGDLFPPNRRARVFSAMSAASAVGLGGGIFLGGSLSEHFGWRDG